MVPALRELIPSGTPLAGSLGVRVKLEGLGRRLELRNLFSLVAGSDVEAESHEGRAFSRWSEDGGPDRGDSMSKGW